MKIKFVLTSLLAAAAIAFAGIAGAASQELASSSVLEEIKKRGSLRVGMSTFVPWAMRDKQGNLIGFEIDVATKVAEDMEVKIEFVPTAWSGIIPALLAQKFRRHHRWYVHYSRSKSDGKLYRSICTLWTANGCKQGVGRWIYAGPIQ